MSNDFTKQYSDGSSLTESNLDSALTSLKPSVANTTKLTDGTTDGQILTSQGSAQQVQWRSIDTILGGFLTTSGATSIITAASASGANALINNVSSAGAANTLAGLVDGAVTIDAGFADKMFRGTSRPRTGSVVTSPDVAISGYENGFTTSSTSFTTISTLSVTITTFGRPVRIELTHDYDDLASGVITVQGLGSGGASATPQAVIRCRRGSTSIGRVSVAATIVMDTANVTALTTSVPITSVFFTDYPSAGTYTYSIQVRVTSASDVLQVQACRLLAYEL